MPTYYYNTQLTALNSESFPEISLSFTVDRKTEN